MTGVNRMVRSAAIAARTFASVKETVAPRLHKAPKPWNQRWAEGGRRKATEAHEYLQSVRESLKYPSIHFEDGFRNVEYLHNAKS
ncbi:hypothetical protein T484DRAFT_1760474 [Baffinella frigidus]|nr:hypothetical protein T484DRAFT_1760474 [Cryptophyta sp. CCMP2293]